MQNENQLLVLRDNAKSELMQIKTVESGMTHLNKLKTLEIWIKAEKKDADLQNMIAEQKLRTQRILGELLSNSESTGKGGDRKSTAATSVDSLTDMGLTHRESSNFQKIASIPEDEFEGFITSKKEAVNQAVAELTTAGMLRVAKRFTGNENDAPCLDRQIIVYANPSYYSLFLADCDTRIQTGSSRGGEIIKNYYRGLPAQEINNLQVRYREMMVEKAKAGDLRLTVKK